MKKLSGIRASDLLMCVMLSISLFLTLGGCSRLKPFMFIDDGDKAEARLTKVIKAIEEKDKTALIAMFSEQALSEAADIKVGGKHRGTGLQLRQVRMSTYSY